MCSWYGGYRLEDFYSKSFLEGGLTFRQMLALYSFKSEEIADNLRVQAALHGVKMGGSSKDVKNENRGVPLFGDPKDYEGMPEEEREALTQKMMGKHRMWAKRAL